MRDERTKKPDLDDATLQIAKRILSMPPKPHKEMKVGRKKRVVESPKSDSTAVKKKGGRRPSLKRG